MSYWAWIAWSVFPVAFVLGATGWWRRCFVVFGIRSSRMTCKRLGLLVDGPLDSTRVDSILGQFAGGFNAMITASSEARCRTACQAVPTLYRPFAEEGAAMGYTLRHLFRYRPDEFEDRLVKRSPEFRYLYYVGLGFWSGMRNHDAATVMRISERLDPMHRYLCFDGYGFKYAFFDHPKDPAAFARFDRLPGYMRHAAYQGVGRAFYFRFMARPDLLIESIRQLGDYAVDAAAGLGLAAVFVNPDRLELAQGLGRKLPQEWREHFHLGMCFALKARMIADSDQFERDLASVSSDTREAAYASVRECDRVELIARSKDGEDGYRHWRERVAGWMAASVEYPLVRVRKATFAPYTRSKEAAARSFSEGVGRSRS